MGFQTMGFQVLKGAPGNPEAEYPDGAGRGSGVSVHCQRPKTTTKAPINLECGGVAGDL
jgi:hypothetical protein